MSVELSKNVKKYSIIGGDKNIFSMRNGNRTLNLKIKDVEKLSNNNNLYVLKIGVEGKNNMYAVSTTKNFSNMFKAKEVSAPLIIKNNNWSALENPSYMKNMEEKKQRNINKMYENSGINNSVFYQNKVNVVENKTANELYRNPSLNQNNKTEIIIGNSMYENSEFNNSEESPKGTNLKKFLNLEKNYDVKKRSIVGKKINYKDDSMKGTKFRNAVVNDYTPFGRSFNQHKIKYHRPGNLQQVVSQNNLSKLEFYEN